MNYTVYNLHRREAIWDPGVTPLKAGFESQAPSPQDEINLQLRRDPIITIPLSFTLQTTSQGEIRPRNHRQV